MCFKATWVLFACLWSYFQPLSELSPHQTQVRKLLQKKKRKLQVKVTEFGAILNGCGPDPQVC